MDDDGNVLEPVYVGTDTVYCSQDCLDDVRERKAEEKRKQREVTDAALRTWPGIEVTYSNGHMKPPLVQFKFPGGKYSARWVLSEETVSVSKIDVDAWNAFAASVKSGDCE